MKHASTQALFDYWNRRRGRRWAPARSDIDPADIRHVLGDTFMLASDFVDDMRFRLAGTRVCALFAREIKGEAFDDLWNETSREQIEDLLTVVLDEKVELSQVFWDAPKTAPKSNWNCCCCRLLLMAAPAFARSVYWLP